MATIKQLTPLLNKNKFIEIGGELIATHQIRRCFVSKIDTIEGFILSQEKEIQAKLRLREKEKIGRV